VPDPISGSRQQQRRRQIQCRRRGGNASSLARCCGPCTRVFRSSTSTYGLGLRSSGQSTRCCASRAWAGVARSYTPRQILCAVQRGTLRHSFCALQRAAQLGENSPVHLDSSATAAESMLYSRARAFRQLADITGACAFCACPASGHRPGFCVTGYRSKLSLRLAMRN